MVIYHQCDSERVFSGFLIGVIGQLVILQVSATKVIKSVKSRLEWSEIKALALPEKELRKHRKQDSSHE